MRADWIWTTHDGTGGAGALTLASVSGWPGFGNVYASPRRVQYTILQFTDTTLATLAQAESGYGTYTPATGVLTRDQVLRTWDGSTYLPTDGSATAATALNISATAANVRVTCAPTIELLSAMPAIAGSLEGLGTFPLNMVMTSAASALSLNNAELDFNPILIGHSGPFSVASARVGDSSGTYTGGTQSLMVGVYEIAANGLPGKKLIDFGTLGGTAPFAAAAVVSSTPLATPVALEPGWYYQAVLAQFSGGSGTPRMRSFGAVAAASPGGTRFASGATTANELYVAAQTALSDPAPAVAISNNGYSWAVAFA